MFYRVFKLFISNNLILRHRYFLISCSGEARLHLSQIIYDFQNHQLTLKKDALASFFTQKQINVFDYKPLEQRLSSYALLQYADYLMGASTGMKSRLLHQAYSFFPTD